MRPASSGRAAAARRDHQAGHVHHRGVNGAHWSAGHPRGSVTGAEHPSPFRPRRGRRGLRTLLVRYAQLIPVSGWGLVHRASGSRNVAQRSLGPHLAHSRHEDGRSREHLPGRAFGWSEVQSSTTDGCDNDELCKAAAAVSSLLPLQPPSSAGPAPSSLLLVPFQTARPSRPACGRARSRAPVRGGVPHNLELPWDSRAPAGNPPDIAQGSNREL